MSQTFAFIGLSLLLLVILPHQTFSGSDEGNEAVNQFDYHINYDHSTEVKETRESKSASDLIFSPWALVDPPRTIVKEHENRDAFNEKVVQDHVPLDPHPVLTRLSSQTGNDDDIETRIVQFDSVPVRLYRLKQYSWPGPYRGLLHIHGGGWVGGDINTPWEWVMEWVRKYKVVAFSVGYRLAPQNPYPAPNDDCATALKHFMLNAAEWNVDPQRIAVTGESAGGHLTLALSVRWRHIWPNFPVRGPRLYPIALQVPFVPVGQCVNSSTVSYLVHENDLLHKTSMMYFWAAYILGQAGASNTSLQNLLYSNSHTTPATRARFASLYEMPAPKTDQERADRAKAAQLRADPKEQDPMGNAALEAQLFRKMTIDEVSPLFVDWKSPGEDGGEEDDSEDGRKRRHWGIGKAGIQGIPPTFVYTSGIDVLHDDGLLVAQRYAAGGVLLNSVNAPQEQHGGIDENIIFNGLNNFLADNPVW